MLDTDITNKHFICLQNVLKTSSRYVLKTSSRHIFKTSSKRLEDQQIFAGWYLNETEPTDMPKKRSA